MYFSVPHESKQSAGWDGRISSVAILWYACAADIFIYQSSSSVRLRWQV